MFVVLSNFTEEVRNALEPCQRIQQHLVYLVNAINPHPGFLGCLQKGGVLSDAVVKDIMLSNDSQQRNKKLLRFMCEKSSKDFETFVKALVTYHQKHVADLLGAGICTEFKCLTIIILVIIIRGRP